MSAWMPTLLLETAPDPAMTPAAWVFLGLAWLFVIALATWCFWRVLGGRHREP